MSRTPPDLRKPPRERHETLRQAILGYLGDGPMTARELSGLLHIREPEVVPHLEHLERSLRQSRQRLAFEPAECLACGFRFATRRRLTRPGGCPRCRERRIAPPVFRLEPRAASHRVPERRRDPSRAGVEDPASV